MNLRLIMLLSSSLLLSSCGHQNGQVESASKAASQAASTDLDPRIPPDDPDKYKSIRDARDWQNPYLVIQRDGIAFRCLAISEQDWQIIAPEELREKLMGLPVSAWPYGRTVAVQEIGIRSGGDDKYIAADKGKVDSVLESLGIKNYVWPSA